MPMPLPFLSPKLGKQVTTRQVSWKEMVIRMWGSEYSAPDHRIYVFSNGRAFDSTDRLTTGIYRQGRTLWTLDEAYVTLGTPADTLDGSITDGFPPGGAP